MNNVQYIAKILRIDEAILEETVKAMEAMTGKTSILDDIARENNATIEKTVAALGIKKRTAEEIAAAFENLLAREDKALFDLLDKPDLSDPSRSRTLIEKAYGLADGHIKGFFLKEEKARAMLLKTPPPSIIQGLGYRDAEELLEKERMEEIFAALRFIETREWMNEVFVKHYHILTPEDFEERPVKVFVLQQKWLQLAEKFLEKKYHNVSHLKELGVVFIIPIKLDTTGETLRLFSLLLHYLYEVFFYAKIIKKYALDPSTFSQNLASLIRGDVGNLPSVEGKFVQWLIVQRYLSKDDENDSRLFLPHVNPEAIHWRKAEQALAAFALNEPSLHLDIFRDIDWAGGFFPSEKVGELLVSFDLVDNVMSLVKRESMIKYLYHHQEALWNRIFSGFTGEEKMEELIIDNLAKGHIEFNNA